MSRLLPKFVSDAATRFHRSDSEPGERSSLVETTHHPEPSPSGPGNGSVEYRETLLRHVKREVKQLMEESVTRKFIHEDSSVITFLCAAVESCLLHGLRRQGGLPGVFRENTSLTLLHRIAKSCQPARHVVERLAAPVSGAVNGNQQRRLSATQSVKYQWIRVALLEKKLAKVIEYLVEHGRQYYEPDSIIGDPCDGPLLASLLVGPCALNYTKVKTLDHLFSDPSADELVQRYRIHSPMTSPGSPKVPRTPSLRVRRHQSSGIDYISSVDMAPLAATAGTPGSLREAAASSATQLMLLHQTGRAALLFGKNSVQSQGASLTVKVPGYLALHATQTGLIVKWTPNSVMLGGSGGNSGPAAETNSQSPGSASGDGPESPGQLSVGDSVEALWDAAFTLHVENMVYIHCHSNQSNGCSLVFVARDGTQQPPLHFPPGGHLLQFLTCLETGLAPAGSLDPPLWSHRSKGKVLPQLKRKSIFADNFLAGLLGGGGGQSPNSPGSPVAGNGYSEEPPSPADESMDYVFRIVFRSDAFSYETAADAGADVSIWQGTHGGHESPSHRPTPVHRQQTIQQLCQSMRRQILSRAFCGWLAHVRHVASARRCLRTLITADGQPGGGMGRPEDYSDGLTPEIFDRGEPGEIYRAVYWGGCRAEMRKTVWPLLLGFHQWGTTAPERRAKDEEAQMKFENLLSDWGPVDVIVRENDKEFVATARDVLLKKLETVEAASATASPKQSFIQRLQQTNYHVQHHLLPGRLLVGLPKPLPDPPAAASWSACEAVSVVVESQDTASVDIAPDPNCGEDAGDTGKPGGLPIGDAGGAYSLLSMSRESLGSPASNGGIYSTELIESVTKNWHRIDKDVTRCDRHTSYFSNEDHLDKLRNIMCCYVWQNLRVGYIQGFCYLLAPLLIVLEDEGLTLACFSQLMSRMVASFPSDDACEELADGQSLMNDHLENLKCLIQVMDPQLHDHILRMGDSERTQFFFCFRWFLLDFKREFFYDDTFRVWETIWAASHLVSSHFNIFLAMALLQEYRGVIIENDMNLSSITKFYIDMAEHHKADIILSRARSLVIQLVQLSEKTSD